MTAFFKKYQINGTEWLFFAPYIFFLIVSILTVSFYAEAASYFYYAAPLMFISLLTREIYFHKISGLQRRFSVIEGGAFLLLMIPFMTSYRDEFAPMLCMTALIYCGRDIPFKKIAGVTVRVILVLLWFIIFSSLLGIIPDYIEDNPDRVRHYIGFRYSLFPAELFFNVTLMEFFLEREHMPRWKIVLLLAGNVFIFIYTNSHLSFGLSLMALAVIIIMKRHPEWIKPKPLIRVAGCCAYIVNCLLSFVVMMNYNSERWLDCAVDDFLGNRISLGYSSLCKNGLTWWGQRIEMIGNGLWEGFERQSGVYSYVDNLYAHVALKYGLIFLIIMVAYFTLMTYLALKNEKYYLFVALLFLSFQFLIDDLGLYLFNNSFWLVTGTVLYEQRERGKETVS